MKRLLNNISGFSMVELIVAIVVLGILAAVAMQSMSASVEDVRIIETEREMEMLASAIVGQSDITQAGARSDFGYVGDIGAFPPNLQALFQNPGGYATWDGPYIPPGFTQDTDGFNLDAWGKAYSYSGGITIASTGGGGTITKKIADAESDYLQNTFDGSIGDANDSVPGLIFRDSIDVEIIIPNGTGGILTKSYAPDSAGAFTLDVLPVGTHPLRIVFTPAADTLLRYVTILPRHKSSKEYRFAFGHFAAATATPVAGADTLRPDGDGPLINLTPSGCGSNYLCVDDVTSDGSSTSLSRGAGGFATDVYSFDDPADTSGNITGVIVYCRALKSKNVGRIKPTLYIGSSEYNGATQDLTGSWADYSLEWTTNPATGADWTWHEIIDLQAGLSLDGQNSSFPAYCTQVWVVVAYVN